MRFKNWFETDNYQKVFPWASQEDPPDLKKINRYKNRDNYVNAMSKGGRQTERAAEQLISKPFSSPLIGQEEIAEIVPGAIVIPQFQLPDGRLRPQWTIAVVHTKTIKPANEFNPKYNKPRHRLLAYWQGQKSTFNKSELEYESPIGGLSFIGDYIDTVWVHPEYRGDTERYGFPNLYKKLREFATRRGIVGLSPDDDLTSKSFRAAQAKYDWKRAGRT